VGEKSLRREGLDPGAVIEELPEPNCKKEVAEKGVIQAGKEERTRVLVRYGKEESADNAEAHGLPIAEDDVDESEGQRAGQ